MPTAPRFVLLFVPLLLALTFAPTVVADDEPEGDGLLVARFFDIEALTAGHTDFLPEQMGLISPDRVSDEENPLFGAEAEEPTLPVGTVEDLVEILRKNVDPVSWQITPGASMRFVGEHTLLVQATKSVMEKVARYLAALEADALTTVTLEVQTVAVDRLDGGATAERLLEQGRRGPAVTLASLVGQRASAFAGGQTSYVADYDVEVAEEAKDSDPIVGVVNHGLVVDARSRVGGDAERLRVDLDATLARIGEIRDHTTYENRTIQLPSLEMVEVHTQLLLKPGVWHVGEGSTQSDQTGRWFFLVRATPSRVLGRPAPAPALYDPHARADKGELKTRAFDVSDLFAPRESYLGRRVNLVPSNYTPPERAELPEPMPVVQADALAELLPALVVPGAWKRDGTSIEAWNDRLFVTNTARVLEELEKALRSMRRQFLWTIAMDVEVVAVPPEFGSRLVAPAGDGYLVGAEEQKALEAMLAGGTAGLVDRVRVVSLAGSRNAVLSGREFSYVQDYEIEIAKGTSIANPVVQTGLEGIVADLRPSLTSTRDAVNLAARLTRARLAGLSKVTTPHGPLDAPRLEMTHLRTNLRVPLGGTAVVGVDARPDASLVVLVTPTMEMRAE